MRVANIHEAKTKLSWLISEVELHNEVVRICRNGKPVAELVPISQRGVDPLVQHEELLGVQIKYDPTAPLCEDEWPKGYR